MVSSKVFILTNEPRTDGNESSMVLYGASELGAVEVICKFQPYFYIPVEATVPKELLAPSKVNKVIFEQSTLVSLGGVKVRKVTFSSLTEFEEARERFLSLGIPLYESDVRARERFMMDHQIYGGVIVEGDAEKRGNLLRFKNPKLIPSKVSIQFKICSLDIETSTTSRSIFSIAVHLSGKEIDVRKVFMQGTGESQSDIDITFVPNERALLSSFLKWFLEADPDVVIGWNVIGFDLAYLRERADSLRLSLPLGRAGRTFSVSEKTGRFALANVPGRVILDGPQVLRNSFYSFESYSLENVATNVLGEGKLIGAVSDKGAEIERLFREDKRALAEYNLKDTVLVTKIFEKLRLMELTIRRAELSGMLLDNVGRSVASFEHYFLPRLHEEGYVAPDLTGIGQVGSASGGHVMSPKAGIYDHIIGLDFQSLYPTIIRTFGIDPLSRACAEVDPLITPGGFRFSRTRSILPHFIAEMMKERQKAKKEKNTILSQAIKILMNSFYGVMGTNNCRLYHPDLPDAISSCGQWLLIESKNWIEERGHSVIYGDTDSLFVQINPNDSEGESNYERIGEGLGSALTEYWKKRIKKEFKVDSYLSLDFKKHYKKFLVPSARGGEGGAKKRYAGLVLENGREEVEFVGLEVVRSDWTKLAQDFQTELYSKVFRGEAVEVWIRDYVAKVRSGEFDEKLTYRKRLHKPPTEYGNSPPPYARAALLLRKPVREVRYIVTLEGPIPIELSPKNPDYLHYIDKQLRPVADSILEVMGSSFEAILSAQLRLL